MSRVTCPSHVRGHGDGRWLFLTLMASLLSMVLKSGTFTASVLAEMPSRTDSVSVRDEQLVSTQLLIFTEVLGDFEAVRLPASGLVQNQAFVQDLSTLFFSHHRGPLLEDPRH